MAAVPETEPKVETLQPANNELVWRYLSFNVTPEEIDQYGQVCDVPGVFWLASRLKLFIMPNSPAWHYYKILFTVEEWEDVSKGIWIDKSDYTCFFRERFFDDHKWLDRGVNKP